VALRKKSNLFQSLASNKLTEEWHNLQNILQQTEHESLGTKIKQKRGFKELG
jgi:hypothetical protein